MLAHYYETCDPITVHMIVLTSCSRGLICLLNSYYKTTFNNELLQVTRFTRCVSHCDPHYI